ncbi:hypothetical protein [Salarchaeum sp. JOR-1]|uniref:hypothetical protein n=1 Tax=Salarchaeum sp. JOR-1 TaxID=2599399 RepID=UPI0011985C03|nr:hypothetical protein [Salarchaeum sp. JOR-1]QDX40850.1 hypothetical protein FQU85_08025 [Salarchaeum sp. JOR-1]
MSAADTTTGGGTDDDYVYEPESPTAERIIVGDERLPVVDNGVTTHVRKQGVMDVNRLTTVQYIATGLGHNWNQVIGFTPNSEGLLGTPVDVQYRHDNDGTFTTAHRGYVKGIGGTGEPNKLQLQVGSVADFLSEIPASKKFGGTASAVDVLTYIVDTLEDGQPVFDDVSVATADTVHSYAPIYFDDVSYSIDDFLYILGGGGGINFVTGKRFTANRDTLADVLDWFRYHTNLRLWFEPKSDGGLVLVVADNFPQPTFRQTALGGSIDVLQNNALWQMRPFTRLHGVGRTGTDVPMTDFEVPVSTSQYPVATAKYEPLEDRLGGPVTTSVDIAASNLGEARNTVKTMLKSRLDEAGGGMIATSLEPSLYPFGELRAKPTVHDETYEEPPTLSYEIESLQHQSGTDMVPHTKLRVSMFVDTDDIEIVDSQTGMTSGQSDVGDDGSSLDNLN